MNKMFLIIAVLALTTVLFALSVPTVQAAGPPTGSWGSPYHHNPYQGGGYYGHGNYNNTGYYGYNNRSYYNQRYTYNRYSYNRNSYNRSYNVQRCCCCCYCTTYTTYNKPCNQTYYGQYPQQRYNNYHRANYSHW